MFLVWKLPSNIRIIHLSECDDLSSPNSERNDKLREYCTYGGLRASVDVTRMGKPGRILTFPCAVSAKAGLIQSFERVHEITEIIAIGVQGTFGVCCIGNHDAKAVLRLIRYFEPVYRRYRKCIDSSLNRVGNVVCRAGADLKGNFSLPGIRLCRQTPDIRCHRWTFEDYGCQRCSDWDPNSLSYAQNAITNLKIL